MQSERVKARERERERRERERRERERKERVLNHETCGANKDS
jgi:hypothetical protein